MPILFVADSSPPVRAQQSQCKPVLDNFFAPAGSMFTLWDEDVNPVQKAVFRWNGPIVQCEGKWLGELKSLYPYYHFDTRFEAFYTYFHTKIDGFVFSKVSRDLVLFLNVWPGHITYEILVLIFWCIKDDSFERYQKTVGPTGLTVQFLPRFLP